MERAVQIFAVVHCLTMGLSHIVQPRAWADFFLLLRDKGRAGAFVVAFLSLGFGSIVVAFHEVWTGLPLALTVLGWAQVLKGFLYFLFPQFALRRLALVSRERAHLFVYPGVVLVALAGLLAYHLAVS